jgi:hypothetical protein
MCPYPPSSFSWMLREKSCSSQFSPEIRPVQIPDLIEGSDSDNLTDINQLSRAPVYPCLQIQPSTGWHVK